MLAVVERHSWVRGRSVVRAGVVSGLLVIFCLASVVSAPPGAAWERLGCRGASGSIKIFITSNTSPHTNLIEGANLWEPGTRGFSFTRTTVRSERDMYANNRSFGATGWTGFLHDWDVLTRAPVCRNGRFLRTEIIASVNNHYNRGHADRRRATAAHEFGHYLGLAHNGDTVRCVEGGSVPVALMFGGPLKYTSPCGFFRPQLDDRRGATAIHD